MNLFSRRQGCARLLILLLALAPAGCGALSPAFVNLLDPTGSGRLSSIDNPPGLVVAAFVNNAEIDERLLNFLESTEGGSLVLTNAEKQSLRPRMRFRIRATFADGEPSIVEFVSGSTRLVQSNFNSGSEPDLNQNALENVVFRCGVVSLEVLNPIEVFVPVETVQFQFVEPTDNIAGFLREQSRLAPRFLTLRTDDVDADRNVVLRRNIDVRDVAAPADNPQCGAVITIIADGVLSVPFLDQFGLPGWDVADVESVATNGGRFEFRVSVQ